MKHLSRPGVWLALAAVAFAPAAVAQMDPLPSRTAAVAVDSGAVQNGGAGLAPVWAGEVSVPGAQWLRLSFDEASLAGTPGVDGSYLVVTSALDGAWQRLDAVHVRNWGMTSAYFNGDTVLVELWSYPGTGASRVAVSEVEAGEPGDPESICDGRDDRDLSYDTRVARLSTGCTAWLIDHGGSANRYLTAGHCIGNSNTTAVMFFNVPLSTTSGGFRAPPPEYQYPIEGGSVQSSGSGGVGNDVATFQSHVNSNTGLPPFTAQGAAFELAAAAPPANNQPVRVTGFGVRDGNFPIPQTWSRTQKTHVGPLVSRTSTALRYRPDTTGGNSGSPVILESTGQAIAIHTHGGCTSSGGSNAGSAIEHPTLQGYLADPRGTNIPHDPLGCLETLFASNNGGDVGGAVYFDVSVGGSPLHIRAVELNTGSDRSTEFGVSVYRADDGAGGKITDPARWTKVGEGWGLATGTDNPTRIVLRDSFILDANRSYGIAVVLDGASHRYTNGTGSNEHHTSPEMELTAGWATNEPFAGTVLEPRVFNGRLCYEFAPEWIIGNLPGNDATQSTNLSDGRIKAMGFSMPAGDDYLLDDATIRLEFTGTSNTPLVRVFDDESGAPGRSLITLDNPRISAGTGSFVFTPPSRFVLEAGRDYWLVVYSSGADEMHWKASDPPRFPTGLASHSGSLWSGTSGPNPPPASATSAFINSYAIHGTPADACYPDCDGDGVLDFFDFLCFQNAFLAQDPYADCDGDGVFDFFDFLCFQNEFLAGCP